MGPTVMIILILLAILTSPWFSWEENALSDLGVDDSIATLFNSSLIVGGLLLVVFAVGLQKILMIRRRGHAGTFILVLASLDLCAIGVFPETTGMIHYYVSVALFTLLPLSFILMGSAIIQRPSQRNLGLFTVFAGVVAGGVWIVPWGGGLAIPETFAALPILGWSIVLGIRLFKKGALS